MIMVPNFNKMINCTLLFYVSYVLIIIAFHIYLRFDFNVTRQNLRKTLHSKYLYFDKV